MCTLTSIYLLTSTIVELVESKQDVNKSSVFFAYVLISFIRNIYFTCCKIIMARATK